MFYSTMFTEFLRICRATSSYDDFNLSVHRLISLMKKQSAEINNIIKALSKIIFCHTDFSKFNLKQEDTIKGITS